MKPFATLGSEISKVRERVRKGAEALRPAKVASDVRDQRDRLLAKLGEQTFRLIAERKLQVPKVLQESVEKLAALLGVQLPPQTVAPDAPAERPSVIEQAIEGAVAVASDPLQEPIEVPGASEPSVADAPEAAPVEEPVPSASEPSSLSATPEPSSLSATPEPSSLSATPEPSLPSEAPEPAPEAPGVGPSSGQLVEASAEASAVEPARAGTTIAAKKQASAKKIASTKKKSSKRRGKR